MVLKSYFKFITLLFLIVNFNSAYSQAGTWSWVRGSNTVVPPSNFGTKGVANPSNEPPALYEPAHWIDKQGNFWVFGGLKSYYITPNSTSPSDIETNDLWKYEPSTNLWTWINGGLNIASYGTKGVSSPTNWPPITAWCSLTWTDNDGNLWMYGGVALNWAVPPRKERSNMMWKYNIQSGEWTWMYGNIDFNNNPPIWNVLQQPSHFNTPGARGECSATWVDDENNLWFFGGMLEDVHNKTAANDMWKYTTSNNQWICMKGPTMVNHPGSYGTKGVESSSNVPPARACNTGWKDGNGNFYIFGGWDAENYRWFNDTWRYNTHTNNWTWLAGPDTASGPGEYGDKCIISEKLNPRSRMEERSPKILGCKRSFMMFGGTNDPNFLKVSNDLWEFDIATNSWRWLTGNDTVNAPGVFGTKGVASSLNTPPCLAGTCMWMDDEDNLWLFGGVTQTDSRWLRPYLGMNTVWKFTPDKSCYTPFVHHNIYTDLPKAEICPGDTTALSLSSGSNYAITPDNSVLWIDSLHALLFPDTTTTYYITGATACNTNDSNSVEVNVHYPKAAFEFFPPITTLDKPEVELKNFSDPTFTTTWYPEDIAASITGNTVQFSDTGTYCLMLEVTDNIGCRDSIEHCINVYGKSMLAVPDAFTPNGDEINDHFTVFGTNIIEYQILIYNRWGELVYFSKNVNELNDLDAGWNGIYKDVLQKTGIFAYTVSAKDINGVYFKKTGNLLMLL